MPKKEGAKKPVSKKSNIKPIPKSADVNKVLVQNFASLQHVMTTLAEKFDKLGSQISKLLELFEASAKTLAEKDLQIDKAKDSKVMSNKLDSLLDQNKTIAKGLTMLHEKPADIPMQRQMPPMMQSSPPSAMQEKTKLPPIQQSQGGYQKSTAKASPIPSKPKPTKKIKKDEDPFE